MLCRQQRLQHVPHRRPQRRQQHAPKRLPPSRPSSIQRTPLLHVTMVEGHQCHRVGAAHRLLLLGKAFTATSPNGRFTEGAAAISGKVLRRIEVHGKNLFYFFGGGSNSSDSTPGGATDNAAAAALSPPAGGQAGVPWFGGAAGALLAAGGGSGGGGAGGGAWVLDPLAPGQGDQGDNSDSDSDSGDGVGAPAAAAAAAAGRGAPATPAARRPRSRRGSGSGSTAAVRSDEAQPAATAAAAAAAAAAGPPVAVPAGGGSSDEGDVVVVNIHFGMSGAFRTASLPGPAPTLTTRLRLEHSSSGIMAHLSAMTVVHGGLSLYNDRVRAYEGTDLLCMLGGVAMRTAKLGPDPLRADADPEAFWQRVARSRKPIGLLLMDQSAIAGVGNIYRAEILFKAAVHPEQPGNSLSRAQVMQVWRHSSELLQRGFASGSILTVDPEEAARLGKPWTRRYIYNQSQCGRCKGPVRTWGMAGRTVYCCATCQPLRLGGADAAAAAAGGAAAAAAGGAGGDADAAVVLTPARLKSMASARVAKKFKSACAPDETDELPQKGQGTGGSARGQRKARGRAASAAAATAAAAAAAGGDGDEAVKPEAADASGSEDEVDRAEAALGAALSVPPPAQKPRARRSSAAAAAAAAGASAPDAPATPVPPPGSRRRGRAASGAASAVAAASSAAAPAAGAPGFASASAAAAEKAAAGENKAVEHVALLADAATEALMFGQPEPAALAGDAGGGGRAKRARRT